MNADWSKQDIARVADLLREGASASQIATEFRDRTRNSIIGLVHRNKTLAAIGFFRAAMRNHGGGRKKGDAPRVPRKKPAPKPAAPRGPKPAPFTLPGRLLVREEDRKPADPVAMQVRVATPRPVRLSDPEPHSVGMRFIDALFDRCRMPIDKGLKEIPGPDMLVCATRVELTKSYCRSCEVRYNARPAEYTARAA